jgi:hypothetical protein
VNEESDAEDLSSGAADDWERDRAGRAWEESSCFGLPTIVVIEGEALKGSSISLQLLCSYCFLLWTVRVFSPIRLLPFLTYTGRPGGRYTRFPACDTTRPKTF